MVGSFAANHELLKNLQIKLEEEKTGKQNILFDE
jgi:hypothetical protein